MKSILAFIYLFTSTVSNAQIGGGFASDGEDSGRARISEYYYSKSGRELLKPVYLLGAVEKPGLYHVPVGTPYLTLLSLSGGPNNSADIEEIVLTRTNGDQKTITLKDIMRTSKDYAIADGDSLFIPAKVGWFDSAQTNDIMVIVGILTLLLTAYVVADTSK